jgi:hypothetical protein
VKVLIAAALIVTGQVAAPQVTQAQLNKLSDGCKAPRAWLRSKGDNEVRFRPSPNAKYQTVDCVLNRMKRSKLPMKLGFIGNEQYEPVK